MSYLISNAAGEVLGPRPGKAACSFGQGICEMILRIGVAVSDEHLNQRMFTTIFYMVSDTRYSFYCYWNYNNYISTET